MIKTILVPLGGSATDAGVFATALAAARLFAAHLGFFHIRLSASEAVAYTPHADFALAAGSLRTLDQLAKETANRALSAERHVAQFCADNNLALSDAPVRDGPVSASWCEESHKAIERLVTRARHNDLVVMGRAVRANGLPRDILERVLIGSGRPLLIAPRHVRPSVSGTVVVCWQETPQAARALTAAMPFVTRATRVVFLSVEENGSIAPILQDVARKMAWHGLTAETLMVANDGRATAVQLFAAADRLGADLVVMGSFSHSRAHEIIFGSCTRAALESAELPVLIVH